VLPAVYFIAEETEWRHGVVAVVGLAVVQTAAALFFVPGPEGAELGLTAGLRPLVEAVRVSGVARVAAVISAVLGIGLTTVKLRDGLRAGRHFQEERILGRLKSVSDEIDPEGHDPAREMIFQHRREGRRRRYRGALLLPAMVLAAIIPAPGGVSIMSTAVGSGQPALGMFGLAGYVIGLAVALTAVSLAVIAAKNGGLFLLRPRAARVVHMIVELLGAAAVLVLAVAALNAAFGAGAG
jgi:ABC-type nickel/cobalt efflux system permease component RcnA